jgi:hypothetical protein
VRASTYPPLIAIARSIAVSSNGSSLVRMIVCPSGRIPGHRDQRHGIRRRQPPGHVVGQEERCPLRDGACPPETTALCEREIIDEFVVVIK